MATVLANKTASSLSDVKQLGSALNQVTLIRDEVPVDIQVRNSKRKVRCFVGLQVLKHETTGGNRDDCVIVHCFPIRISHSRGFFFTVYTSLLV